MENKKPFYVNCSNCSHSWVLFYTPIQIDLVKKFRNATCPSCANTKGILCGKGNQQGKTDGKAN